MVTPPLYMMMLRYFLLRMAMVPMQTAGGEGRWIEIEVGEEEVMVMTVKEVTGDSLAIVYLCNQPYHHPSSVVAAKHGDKRLN